MPLNLNFEMPSIFVFDILRRKIASSTVNIQEMEIYIEVVFAFNYIIDILLLFTLKHLFKCDGKIYRLFIASGFSSTIAILLPLFNVNTALNIVVKLLLSFVVVKIAFKGKLLKNLVGFYMLTFFAGGVVVSFNMFVNTNVIKTRMAILAVVILCFIATVICVKKVKELKYFNSYYFNVLLCLKNKVYKLKGFLDSGNMLVDAFGAPICVIGYDIIKGEIDYSMLLNLVKQPYKSADISSSNLFLIKAEYITVRSAKWQKTYKSVVLGVVLNEPFDGDFDILLHPYIICDL